MSFTQKDRVELEELMQDFNRPVASAVMPRWQRKTLRAAAARAGSAATAGVSACDISIDLTGAAGKANTSKAGNGIGAKRSCPSTPGRAPPASPCKRVRTTKTPSKTPSHVSRSAEHRTRTCSVAVGCCPGTTHPTCTTQRLRHLLTPFVPPVPPPPANHNRATASSLPAVP